MLTIFLAEALIMLFPVKWIHGTTGVLTRALADAGTLTVVSSPAVWWALARHRRVMLALEDSEKRYRSLAENALDLILEATADGCFTYASPNYREVLGYEPEELLGTGIFDRMHPADRPAVMAEFARAMSSQTAGSATFRYRHKNGDWRWFESAGKPFFGGDGRPRAVIISRDITARVRTEEAVRLVRELTQGVAAARHMAEALDTIMRRICETTEWTCADVWVPSQGNGHLEWRAAWHGERDDLREFTEASRRFTFRRGQGLPGRVWEGGQPLWVPDVTQDANFPRAALAARAGLRAAAGIPVLAGQETVAVICFYMSAIREEDERLVAVTAAAAAQLGTLVRLRLTEESLRQSEERARRIVETAYDAFVSIDASGAITAWNAAAERIFGWNRDEVIGRRLTETIIPPRYRDAHAKGLKRFLATGEGPILNQRIEIAALHRDGREFPVELAAWAVPSGDGWTFHAFIHDVTQRKQAEEELRRLNAELRAERETIRSFNRSLEATIRERTKALREANRELRQRNRQLLDARAQAATDALTGLGNHRSFQERIRQEVAAAQESGSPVGLIMLDVDGFKSINDTLGHLQGDRMLRDLSKLLASTVDRGNIFRYGGDEFAIILPGLGARETAAVAEDLRQRVAGRFSGSSLTISLGTAVFPDSAASVEELIYGADSSMYSAKFSGKNRVGRWDLERHAQHNGGRLRQLAPPGEAGDSGVAALIAALAAKDPTTGSHLQRCATYALALARELGLSPEDCAVVRQAALLHDIGKLAVREDVLLKPGGLDAAEWEEMRRHPLVGRDILSHIRSLARVTPAVLHHHERYDGQGYPSGLKGTEIPIASRILLVTDAFDAMTTDRPYRRALPLDAAIRELQENAGSQFDPVVVEAFLRMLGRGIAGHLRQPSAPKKIARAASCRASGQRAAAVATPER